MIKKTLTSITATALMLTLNSSPALAEQSQHDHQYDQKNEHSPVYNQLQTLMAGEHRSAKNIARNQYRHPAQTLDFLGLTNNMTVVEIWPGGGWYSEILAPLLKDNGQYYAAGFSLVAQKTPNWKKNYQKKFQNKLKQAPELYGKTIITDLEVPERPDIAPAESADLVLTFRNVHNWMKSGDAPAVFQSMNNALKKGGILGVIEHRAKPGTRLEDMIRSGYVTENYVIKLAEDAGFKLAAKSEINANAKDTKQHPKGVWTLPPSLRLGDQDRAKYLAIGESDRMTLKFIKR